MPYQMQDPGPYFAGAHTGAGTVTLFNIRGTYSAASADVDKILDEAWCQGDSTYAGVCYLLERLSQAAGIDIPDDNYSMTELAIMIANAETNPTKGEEAS